MQIRRREDEVEEVETPKSAKEKDTAIKQGNKNKRRKPNRRKTAAELSVQRKESTEMNTDLELDRTLS